MSPLHALVRRRTVLAAVGAAAALALVPLGASGALASDGADGGPDGHGAPGAVFVQLNGTTGNTIAAYTRHADGTLTAAGRYATGGLGGTQVGAPLDALASQGSLVLDERDDVLLAVNAGSDSVTAFGVHGAALGTPRTAPSGGHFPTSIAVHGDLVYVLDAGGDGAVSGFRLVHGALVPIPGSTRSLGLGGSNPPVFIASPGQIGFAADGHALVVTTKNHDELLSFPIDDAGLPAATPVATPSAGPVPFSFVVDRHGGLQVTEAGTGRTSTYTAARDGSLHLVGSSAPDGGAALCWNVLAGRTLLGANAGSATLSAWAAPWFGPAVLTAPVAASTGAGPIDLAASHDGRFVYVQESVAGTVGAYAVSPHGTLTRIQTVSGLPAFSGTGMEGIAAR
ncbi:lactonase family protein [Cellulomonas sp. SG140]|uniref:lactonase family protein n=1 Tax=Cellulomonas sp. SG140 TaxID=2976536 RepID=UPI0021E6EC96|nr:lactonase family protein [Cellulomonas sp. SG140]